MARGFKDGTSYVRMQPCRCGLERARVARVIRTTHPTRRIAHAAVDQALVLRALLDGAAGHRQHVSHLPHGGAALGRARRGAAVRCQGGGSRQYIERMQGVVPSCRRREPVSEAGGLLTT